jgi:hypothetical protein
LTSREIPNQDLSGTEERHEKLCFEAFIVEATRPDKLNHPQVIPKAYIGNINKVHAQTHQISFAKGQHTSNFSDRLT